MITDLPSSKRVTALVGIDHEECAVMAFAKVAYPLAKLHQIREITVVTLMNNPTIDGRMKWAIRAERFT